MEHTSSTSIKAARGLIAALIALNLFRAITFPVTVGEAWNYDRYIGPPWREALAHYDPNNHVLNTLLVRISTARFHLTELSLRLPSLLAGLLYLWVVYRLAVRRFGSGARALTVIALLTLNPLVLDAMSEARGYGMALAFLIWALELMLESAESFQEQNLNQQLTYQKVDARKLNLAAVCLGLSVAASLAFAAPAVALGVVFLAWGRGWAWPKGRGTGFALLAFLTAFVLVAVPIDHPDAGAFLQGATSLRQTLNELTVLSLGTSLQVVTAAARVAMAIVAISGAVAAFRMERRPESALVVLTGGTLALTLLILLASHRWLHAPFPQRGAIYLVPLSTLAVTSIILKWNREAAHNTLYAVTALLIAFYLSQMDFHAYTTGQEFAGGKALAKMLRAEVGRRRVSIGVSEAAEPIVNYYRTRFRQGNWQRIERKPLEHHYEYYVLAGPDRALVGQWHLQVLFQDAGLILAQ